MEEFSSTYELKLRGDLSLSLFSKGVAVSCFCPVALFLDFVFWDTAFFEPFLRANFQLGSHHPSVRNFSSFRQELCAWNCLCASSGRLTMIAGENTQYEKKIVELISHRLRRVIHCFFCTDNTRSN
jgi:hypothetical protein